MQITLTTDVGGLRRHERDEVGPVGTHGGARRGGHLRGIAVAEGAGQRTVGAKVSRETTGVDPDDRRHVVLA